MSWKLVVSLFIASAIVAFIAGMIALAMPCCFSVLLPSYFASSFKTKISKLSMTAVFGSGIAVVLLPIAFGASLLSQFIGAQHGTLFVLGGLFMIGIGVWTLWGRFMLPMYNLPVNMGRSDIPSVFTLGLFSGVASSCCAPVLAGIFVLTTLSASVFEAFGVGIAYIFGMVFPLLLAAFLWDQRRKSQVAKLTEGRMMNLRFFGREFSIHSSKLIAGVIFISMGVFTVGLGWTNTMIVTPGAEWLGIYQGVMERDLSNALSSPAIATVITLLLILAIAIVSILAMKRSKKHKVEISSPSANTKNEADRLNECSK